MNANRVAGEDRARLPGAIEDRDDVVEILANEFFETLRAVIVQIDVHLRHRPDCQRVDIGRFTSGTGHIDLPMAASAEDGFRHLGTGAVMRAEKQNPKTLSNRFYYEI